MSKPVPVPELVVTPDDFKNFFGEDLNYILKSSDNESNYPFVFLRMVQDFLIDWCDERGFRRVKFNQLQGIQLEAFQKAVLYQAYYVWKNGASGLGLDSGYDAEKGIVIGASDLQRVEVPERVVTLLHKSGLFNLKMRNRPRVTRGYPGIGGLYTGEDY